LRTVAALFLAAGLTLAACGGGASPAPTAAGEAAEPTAAPAATNELVVLDWSGYELPEFWPAFAEKHPDVQPEYSFFAEDAEAFAKVESGFEVDLLHPCSGWWGLYVESGAVQPIDTSRLSNWSAMRPKLAEQGVFNGQQYFVPWDWGFESILVRTDKVQTIPASWADLWNEEYAGHLTMFDSGETAHIITALALGFDPWATTPEQDEQIKQKLIEIKPLLLNYWSDFTELNQLVASGDVWVAANAWNDAYVAAVAEGVPVQYLDPAEGRLSWLCGYGLASNAKNVDLAYDYLDALIAPEPMAYLSNEYGYGAASTEALALTDEQFVELFGLDDPAVLDEAIFYRPLTNDQRERFTSAWSEVKAAP
jgi:spermidine/putrescine transport system substrate-binding protein